MTAFAYTLLAYALLALLLHRLGELDLLCEFGGTACLLLLLLLFFLDCLLRAFLCAGEYVQRFRGSHATHPLGFDGTVRHLCGE